MPDLHEPLYRYLTVKQRESIAPEDFAWPDAPDGPEYPIDTQEHLDSAATLIGHAPDDKQADIKARAIKIAKRHGFTLPKSWQEDEKPMNKADEADILRANLPTELQLYLPILRVDKEKREVVVRATSEAKDSYNTIFSYEGSKDAFGRWRGNIREMHQNIAVGRAVQITPRDEEKAIDLTLRVSRGAEDTWQKVLDGTLSGASVGARNGTWITRQIDGEATPVLERYDLVEVSLVDNPSNPDANIMIIRADGLTTEVLDATPEPEQEPAAQDAQAEQDERQETPEVTRRGAKHSVETMAALHTARDHGLNAVKSTALNCNCVECGKLINLLDPDEDGDIDVVANLDTDNDAGVDPGSGDGAPERVDIAALVRQVTAEVTRANNEQLNQALKPLLSRFSSIAARFAQIDTTSTHSPELTRRLDALEQKLAEIDKVSASLERIEGQTAAIAKQPVNVVGPVVNAMRHQQASNQERYIADLTRAIQSGTATKDQQLDAAALLVSQEMRRQ